jgi:hypothetical protein
MEAEREPIALGVNVRVKLALPPAAIVSPGFPETLKSVAAVPPTVTAEVPPKVRGNSPLFVMVTVTGELVVPNAWVPKL